MNDSFLNKWLVFVVVLCISKVNIVWKHLVHNIFITT